VTFYEILRLVSSLFASVFRMKAWIGRGTGGLPESAKWLIAECFCKSKGVKANQYQPSNQAQSKHHFNF